MENSVGLYVHYVLIMHVKFLANQMLFVIRFVNSSFMHNFFFKFKHLINEIIIDF